MATLGRLHNMDAQQERRLPGDIPSGFATLSTLHSDMRELTPELMRRFIAPERIYKQHVLPTDNNLDLVRGHALVVLLRKPEDIVLAYRRSVRASVGHTYDMFDGCRTEAQWLDRAQHNGLLDQLHLFDTRWRESEGANKLIVHFDDLKADTLGVINQIETCFNLPLSASVSLDKRRYSRSWARNWLRRIGNFPLLLALKKI